MTSFRDRLRSAAAEAGEAYREQSAWDALSKPEKIVLAARTAHERGDALYQIDLQVSGDTNDVLNAVVAEGWQLLTAGFTADPLAGATHAAVPDMGHYVFVRLTSER